LARDSYLANCIIAMQVKGYSIAPSRSRCRDPTTAVQRELQVRLLCTQPLPPLLSSSYPSLVFLSPQMATNITFHPGGPCPLLKPQPHASKLTRGAHSSPAAVTAEERSSLLGQKGATIWLTGLSASGKVCQRRLWRLLRFSD